MRIKFNNPEKLSFR